MNLYIFEKSIWRYANILLLPNVWLANKILINRSHLQYSLLRSTNSDFLDHLPSLNFIWNSYKITMPILSNFLFFQSCIFYFWFQRCVGVYFILWVIINKGVSHQGYGSSSGHVWMWELDCEESWAPKNWCFWTVVLEKILESPLDCKEINQSILKEISPGSWGRKELDTTEWPNWTELIWTDAPNVGAPQYIGQILTSMKG